MTISSGVVGNGVDNQHLLSGNVVLAYPRLYRSFLMHYPPPLSWQQYPRRFLRCFFGVHSLHCSVLVGCLCPGLDFASTCLVIVPRCFILCPCLFACCVACISFCFLRGGGRFDIKIRFQWIKLVRFFSATRVDRLVLASDSWKVPCRLLLLISQCSRVVCSAGAL